MAYRYVYQFGGDAGEGRADMKNLLGGKGANLAEMTNIKLPVPPGYTITTEVCTHYMEKQGYPTELKSRCVRGWSGWKGLWVRGLAIPTIRCWCRFAPEPVLRCLG